MARILICIYAMPGPINATRKLARDLRERGHTVHYVGLADCAPYLQGESFFPVFSRAFPEPARRTESSARRSPSSRLDRLRGARALSRRARTFVQALTEGQYEGFDRLVARLRPDLMVIESTTFYVFLWGLLAFHFQIPSVLLNDCTTGAPNPFVPPVSSRLQPSPGALGRMQTRLAWWRLGIERRLRNWQAALTTGWNLGALATTLAKGFGCPRELLREHERLYLRVQAPEIVMLPERFDFPHPRQPGRYYSSASVDLTRDEVPFPWECLDASLPVVYCSLGTTRALRPAEFEHFFACVAAAFAPFADRYQLVVATYGHLPPERIPPAARHVIFVTRAPQLSLLRRAALMITHGGSNSVRECLTLGVPMLLYPIDFDQHGHAARVVYHGLGLQGRIRGVSVAGVRRALARLLTHTHYRLQARHMQREFALAEATCSPAMCVEMFLPGHASPETERRRRPWPTHAV